MQLPPVPEPRDLLPPLLACLPTTFLSPQPPPALLPLLAPTLRQRVTYLTSNSSNQDGWVTLLNWDRDQAAKLPSLVEHLDLEPHPVSGEVEIADVRAVKYRRLDDETLQTRLEVEQFELLPIYVWVENDEHGQTGPGWKLTELKSLEDIEDGSDWHDEAANANAAYTPNAQPERVASAQPQEAHGNDYGNDDDYWAAYDRTPGQTPALEQATRSQAQTSSAGAEDDYYARYGSEVQPALDAHDPDEESIQSTLDTRRGRSAPPVEDERPAWQKALYPHVAKAHDSAVANSLSHSLHSELNMPRPISPASSARSVERACFDLRRPQV
ncbi:hypothetical protein AMS68_003740 [Peltaster fructicola]|uniref:Uncharacterized protein n=1 Tax=Peltaster fructicola TaxID=286661 RepID=A0A6H0XU24_9PEZI|nr:hypothetical protein AMS68_003740 [Peltaster fructicola]